MKEIFYIFIGGGIGSVFRYLISTNTQRLGFYNNFPLGTLLVNCLGCLLIGILVSYINEGKGDTYTKFMWITGFCGGFTTFSAFSIESLSMWQNGNYSTFFIYILLSVVLGIGSVLAGTIFFKF